MIGDGYISYPFLSVELGIDMDIGNDLLLELRTWWLLLDKITTSRQNYYLLDNTAYYHIYSSTSSTI